MDRKQRAEERDRETHDGYSDLGNAIIAQAYKDYVSLSIGGVNPSADCNIGEIKQFFKSQWYSELTDIDSRVLLSKAQKEIDIINDCVDDYASGELRFVDYQDRGLISLPVTSFHYLRKRRKLAAARAKMIEAREARKKELVDKINSRPDICGHETFKELLTLWMVNPNMDRVTFKKNNIDDIKHIKSCFHKTKLEDVLQMLEARKEYESLRHKVAKTYKERKERDICGEA